MGYKYFKWERNSFFLKFPQNDFSKIINETVAGACSVFVPCMFYTYCCLRYMTLFLSSLVLLPLGLEVSHLWICLAIVMFLFHGPFWKGFWKQQKCRQTITWTYLSVSCSHEFGILFSLVYSQELCSLPGHFQYESLKGPQGSSHWIVWWYIVILYNDGNNWRAIKAEWYSFQTYLLKSIKDNSLISNMWELWSKDIRCLP